MTYLKGTTEWIEPHYMCYPQNQTLLFTLVYKILFLIANTPIKELTLLNLHPIGHTMTRNSKFLKMHCYQDCQF